MLESRNGQLLVSEDLYTSLITNSKLEGLNMYSELTKISDWVNRAWFR